VPSDNSSAPTNRAARRNAAANRASVGRKYVGIPEAAEYLDLCEKTVRRLVNSGQLNGYYFGRNVLKVKLADLDSVYTTK
jgi:excisionase family DNA binding protein